jgi:hypothetical protein
MDVEQICSLWTHCYHVTAVANLLSIRRSRVLWPAQELLERANLSQMSRSRRTADLELRTGGNEVLIRNQCPLDPGSLELGAAVTLEEYVACLNSYVYFWPGVASGPIEDGRRMFDRTNGISSIVLRMPVRSLLAKNRSWAAYLSNCNSGVAWTEGGVRSRRGPELFQPLLTYSAAPSTVHEICFLGPVALPDDVEFGATPDGPWAALVEC